MLGVHQKLTLMALLTLLCMTSQQSYAEARSCEQEPTARCLVLAAIEHWPHIQNDDPARNALAIELAFEAPYFQAVFPESTQTSAIQHNAAQQLAREESFLRAIQHQNTEQARQQLGQLSSTMQDYLQTPPSALYLEAQILALHDADADRFKKLYYETLLNLDAATRTQRMIAVAQHEILGGRPAKGLHTLENTDIDEFSAPEFFLSRHATELLATRSEQLFLRPDHAAANCAAPDTIGPLLLQHLQDDTLQKATNSHELPDIRIRITLLVLLARLHHNSAQCVLQEKWLTAQAVTLAALTPAENASVLIQNIQLARAIRRYIN